MAHTITTIQDRTREVARLLLLGLSVGAVADELGLTPEHVTDIKNSAIFRKHLDDLQEKRDASFVEHKRELDRLVGPAIASYEAVLRDGEVDGKAVTPALKIKAAGDVLDRTGYGAVRKAAIHSTNTTLTLDDIDEIRKRAANIKKESYVDAEFSEVANDG